MVKGEESLRASPNHPSLRAVRHYARSNNTIISHLEPSLYAGYAPTVQFSVLVEFYFTSRATCAAQESKAHTMKVHESRIKCISSPDIQYTMCLYDDVGYFKRSKII